MTNFESTVSVIVEELSDSINFDRKEFLAECARSRIVKRSQVYDKHFDHLIDLIESSEISKDDFSRTCSTLMSLSSLITQSYDELIMMINKYEKAFDKDSVQLFERL